MTASELITLFRRQSEESAYTSDSDMPSAASLWSNYQLIQFINQAQYEFAERTLCFKDGTTFLLDVEADEPTLTIDERILRIERAELITADRRLDLKTIEEFDQTGIDDYGIRRSTSWRTRTGTPQFLITDITADTARLYPIPEEDDTLQLTVRRHPLVEITDFDDELEVPTRWQYGLLHKLKMEAYSTPQALAVGFSNALLVAEREWEKFIVDASSTIKKKTRRAGKIRYGGI
jgi:hypothetical protein